MNERALIWRDRVLLFAGWAVVLLASVWAWAKHSQTISAAGVVLGSTLWARMLLDVHIALVAIVLALPVGATAVHFTPSLRSLWSRLLASHGREPALLILLGLFGLGELLTFPDIGRLQFSLTFLLELAVVLTAYVLFLGREALPTRAAVLTGTWFLLVIGTRLNLATLQPVLRSQAEPPWVFAWYALFAASLALEIAAPFLLLVPSIQRSAAKAAGAIGRIPLLLSCTFFLTAALIGVIYRAGGETISGFWALQRFATGLALLLACALTIKSLEGEDTGQTVEAPSNRNTWFWGILIVLTVAYIIQAVRIAAHGLTFLNPDGVAYLIIAREYAEGVSAIRGYWSPLLPWILAPIIRLGGDPQVGQRVLAGATGLAWAGLTLLMGKRTGLNRIWLLGLAATMVVLSLQQAFIPVTPDLLGAVILSGYFLIVTSRTFLNRPIVYGSCAGALGALAFFAKFYNLPFFVAHIFLTGVFLVAGGKSWRKAALSIITAWVAAAAIVLPWAIALRGRYGHLMLTTSGPINTALYSPLGTGHPCWDQRLCRTPEDVLIPWEDPQATDYAGLGWSPFRSLEDLRYELLLVQGNVVDYALHFAFRFGPLPPIAAIAMLVGAFTYRKHEKVPLVLGWSFLTLLLYASGYMVFASDVRYYLPIVPVAVVGSFRMIQEIVARARSLSAPGFRKVAEGLLALAAMLSFLYPQAAGLESLPPSDRCVATTVAQFTDKLVAPIAGSDRLVNIIAYYSEKRTLGVLKPTTPASDADTEFHRLGVRTYVVGEGLTLGTNLLARGDYSVLAETNLCGDSYLILRTPVP